MNGKHVLSLWVLCTLLLAISCGRPEGAGVVAPVEREPRETLRAFHGAPPVVPHGIEEEGRTNCIACHGPGQQAAGRVVAAVTPHPNWDQCRQCHVPRVTDKVFVASTFTGLPEPEPFTMPSPFLPPYIPHRLDNDRERRCETCHIGVQAVPELRPAHGPRTNCRQCHIPLQGELQGFGEDVTPFTGLPL